MFELGEIDGSYYLAMEYRVAWADDRLAQVRAAIDASDYLAARSALAAVRDAGACVLDRRARVAPRLPCP